MKASEIASKVEQLRALAQSVSSRAIDNVYLPTPENSQALRDDACRLSLELVWLGGLLSGKAIVEEGRTP